MSRFRFSSTPDSQVDPFNAGEPAYGYHKLVE